MHRIGLIGLGLMGSALAERLRGAGAKVIGYDLSAEAREALRQSGATAAATPGEVMRETETLVLSLPDASVVAAVLDEAAGELRPNLLVVDTTTGDPWQVAATGQWLAERGVSYLDATVAGNSAQLRSGDVVVMAGGPEDAFRRAEPLLAEFARESFHVGDWGSGSRMKLVVNLVLGLNRAVLAEGLSLARAFDIDLQAALDVLRASAAYSTAMDTKGPKMLAGDFTPQARLSQHLKDVRLILAAGERTGARLPLSILHRTLLERVEAAGHGDLDNSAILLAFRDPLASD